MALNFKNTPAEHIYTQEDFAGVDFTSEPSKVSPKRSPESKNMLINKNGYVEKRTGYRRVLEDEGNINGIFEYICAENLTTYRFIHIGTSLYRFTFGENGEIVKGDLLLAGLEDKKSRGFTFGGSLYIIGAGYIKIGYDGFTKSLCYGFVKDACSVTDEAQAQTVISGRTVAGKLDGTRYDYKCDSSYKKIEFSYGNYAFNPGVKMYVAPPEYAGKVRVASVYFKNSNSTSYSRLSEIDYEVKTDDFGLYIQLQYYQGMFDNPCRCAPYVIVQYNSFVYAPTVVTGRAPIGENEFGGSILSGSEDLPRYTGEILEGANLASNVRKTDFYVTAQGGSAKRFYIEKSEHIIGAFIDGAIVQAYRMSTSNTEVLANRTGYVEIANTLIGSGEHVVTIEYLKGGSECDVIDDCSIYAMYGGSTDTRVFVSGNEKYRARDFASGLFDGSYFSDLQYTDVGADESAIVGYHKLYGNLIIVKDGVGNDSAQYLRSFSLATDASGTTTAVFAVKQGNISYGAANASSFKSIGGVPLYLGRDGVFAISGTSVENQNNTACVSEYINGRLKGEENISGAVCAQCGGRYYIFLGNHAYVCDEKNGFEWFYFDGLPEVRCAWTSGNTMYIGSNAGIVYRFMDDGEDNAYYDDVAADGSVSNASAIEAVWEMPASALDSYANYKTVRNCYITCMPYQRSSVKVYYNTNEDYRDWVFGENIDLFSFENVDFDRFTFRSIRAPFVFATGVKVKNVYVFGLRLVNDVAGEPFGFLALSVKYRTGKYVK